MRDQDQPDMQRMMAVLEDDAGLQSRREEVIRRKGLQDVRIGVWANGRTRLFGEDHGPIAAGCLAKPLTAMLIGDAVAEGRLDWRDPVADVLADGACEPLLADVTVVHLLDHTHGLDASNVRGVPLDGDGRVDIEMLCGQLSRQPLHTPGRMYSYGHLGAWLSAGVVERVRGVAYASCLREHVLIRAEAAGSICPATGGALSLTVEQWLGFAQHAIGAHRSASTSIALPGWHPSERAVSRGWKCYGDGWIGHNANLVGSSVLLRLHPEQQVAILVSAREANGAAFAASAVFAEVLPEFYRIRPPRLIKGAEVDLALLRGHIGCYEQAGSQVEIVMNEWEDLLLRVRDAGGESAPQRLRPAEQGLFLAESGGSHEFLFVQFVGDDAPSRAPFLWNGRQVWRRREREVRADGFESD